MSQTVKRSLFAAYVAAVAAVLLWVCFPSEAVRRHAAGTLSAALPGLTVEVASARPILPPAILLKELRLTQGEKLLAVIDRLQLEPEWFSLLDEATVTHFTGSAAGGGISGTHQAAAPGSGQKESLSARIAGVQLGGLPAVQNIRGSRLSGRLEGTLTGDTGGLRGKISVSDLQVTLAEPLLEVQTLTFRTLEAEILLQPKGLVLRSCRLRGNELDAELSGTIALNAPTGGNALNLNGRVTPHHGFMAKMEGSLPPNFLRRRGGLGFKVSGSLEAPGFSLN